MLGFSQAVDLQCAKVSALDAQCFHRLAVQYAHFVGSSRRDVRLVINAVPVLVEFASHSVTDINLTYRIAEHLLRSHDLSFYGFWRVLCDSISCQHNSGQNAFPTWNIIVSRLFCELCLTQTTWLSSWLVFPYQVPSTYLGLSGKKCDEVPVDRPEVQLKADCPHTQVPISFILILKHWHVCRPRYCLFHQAFQSRLEAGQAFYPSPCRRLWKILYPDKTRQAQIRINVTCKLFAEHRIIRHNPSVIDIQLYFPSFDCECTSFIGFHFFRTS